MTEFEKRFLINCLNHIHITLCDPSKFKTGARMLETTKSDSRPVSVADSKPIKILEKITHAEQWGETDAHGFSFAVLSATAYTAHTMADGRPKHNEEVDNAIEKLINNYVPALTANTTAGSRLDDLKRNILQLKIAITAEPTPSAVATAYESFKENPLVFFAQATLAAGTVVGAVAAFGMSRSSNE